MQPRAHATLDDEETAPDAHVVVPRQLGQRAGETGQTPGFLYIPPDDASVPAKWRGIGIRIEDDVLVTRDGHRVLTGALERSADEVEALMAR